MTKIITILSITLIFCSGCSVLRSTTPSAEQIVSPTQSEPVTVGGRVRVPQRIEHNDALTLERVINLAGGSAPNASGQPLLVSLSEKQGVLRQRIFIPLNFVMNSAAGQIQVAEGSHVDIVELNTTTLVKANNDDKTQRISKSKESNPIVNRARITGLVRNSQAFDVDNAFLKFKKEREDARYLSLTRVIGLATPIDASQVDVALLSRPSLGFAKPDIYLIPYLQTTGETNLTTSDSPSQKPSSSDQDLPTEVVSGFGGGAFEEANEDSKRKAAEKQSTASNIFTKWGNEVEVLPLDTIVMTTLNSIPMINNGQLAPLRARVNAGVQAQLENRRTQRSNRTGLLRNRLQDVLRR